MFQWLVREDTMKIRVSIATASLLNLKNYKIDAKPKTLYFLLPEKCKGACGYCYIRKGYLARVRWPKFEFIEVIKKIKDGIAQRICIQTTYNENIFNLLKKIAYDINANIPISVSINPMDYEKLIELKKAGIERIGFGIDACSQRIFNKWKKNVPSWDEYIKALKNAKKIFGNATAHLIIGLGESDEEVIKIMKILSKNGIDIALFAYTKNGETMVDLPRYRIIQISRFFIKEAKFSFENGKIKEIYVPYIDSKSFETSGCPNCNRPFYNERVTKIYNYPYELNENEFKNAIKEAEKYARIYIIDK